MTAPEDSIADRVRRFYDAAPFPGYARDRYNSALDLFGNAGGFARALDYRIPYGARVADIGCGTGQLACLLSLKDRPTLGLDCSGASLGEARALAERLHLRGVRFEHAAVPDLPPPDAPYDYVLCLGVLHHTADPRRGFRSVVSYGKPGSFVIIGLYNSCGRLWFNARRGLRALVGGRGAAGAPPGGEKDYWWFLSQERLPPASSHGAGEVLGWFEEEGVEFVSSVPGFGLRDRRSTGLLSPRAAPSAAARRLAQMRWLWTLRHAGGFFVMIGRIR